ncbi:MAG: ATP-binding protein [Terrimicrobiaceae bacterium]|nr:ATP-binding protein [Terrimicrobiaceae bacterium]
MKSDPASTFALNAPQLRRILSEPEFFRLIFDALPLQVAVKSARPETFGQFLLWNRVAEERLGLPAEETIGRTDTDFFPREQAEFFLAKDREAVRSRRPLDIPEEAILSRSLGTRFLHTVKTPIFDEEGEPLALLVVSEDITDRVQREAERKGAEEALRESEERWELALAGTEAGVWDWNIRTGEVFYSERWQRMFGYSGAELPPTPHSLLELIHSDDRAAVRDCTLALLRRKTDLFRCEYRMRRRDGGHLWILAHAKAHFDGANRATRMIGTLIDISARKHVEAQLVEAKVAAENASRAKGDFLAMMSHEIRTPLNGVLGFADLLAGTPLDPRQSEYLQTLRDSGSILLHVLNDILDYSKIESGKLAIDSLPAALRDIIESSVRTFRATAASKHLELTCEVATEAPAIVVVDAQRLRQVLSNLISNAVKFTLAGSVRVRVEPVGESDAAGRVRLRFTVADTGPGIPAEDLSRLFEPFEQLDASMARRFGGTGLGLAIVHRLVGMLGGEISAISPPGAGTVFTFDLLLAQDAALAADNRAASPSGAAGARSLSILLVDDHAVNRRLAGLMLERLGYSPDEAADGEQAVEFASRQAYDVVLMDIQMPGMDGYEAARRIHEISPASQIVALTAHAMPADRKQSAAHGMCGHLTKPVRIDDLRAALAECADRSSKIAGAA